MRKFILFFCVALIGCSSFAVADSPRLQNPNNGHWYQRIDTPSSWQEAKTYAQTVGGNLAVITSQSEQDFVWNNFGATTDEFIWLGGTDEVEEGVWKWLTGETFWIGGIDGYPVDNAYNNWARNGEVQAEPDNMGLGQNYLAFFASGYGHNGGWDDYGLPESNPLKPFIIEWNNNPDENQLVAYWNFEEPSGSNEIIDQSPMGNDGYLQTATRCDGWCGMGLCFDGTGGAFVPNSPSLNSLPNGFTLSAWINPTEFPDFTTIYWKTDRYNRIHMLHFQTDERLYAAMNQPAPEGGFEGISSPVVTLGEWQHVAWAYDGEYQRFYRNGELVFSAPFSDPWVGNDINVLIGAHPEIDSANFRGSMDEVRVHQGALTQDEILAIAQSPPNEAPVLGVIGDKSVAEGDLLSFVVTATDPDPEDQLEFTADNLPFGATFVNNGDRTATFSWTPAYNQAAYYSVTFTVSDGILMDSDTIMIIVININRADLDHDGDADYDDYQIFLSAFGHCTGDFLFNPDADLDRDGCVTLVDYQIWRQYYMDYNGRDFLLPMYFTDISNHIGEKSALI